MKDSDLVTSLREVRGGYRVTVNDTETFRLSKAEYRELPIAEGQALDFEQYRQELLLLQYPAALDHAVKLLALRPRSIREVERNLNERGCLSDTVEMVLYKMEKEKLLDDETFARSWAHARASLGLGRPRILQELRQKGVDGAIARAAVAELDTDETDTQAMVLAMKLLRRHPDIADPDAIRKALEAMQRRGYSYGEAARALKAALRQMKEDL
jgi:regulatory protein